MMGDYCWMLKQDNVYTGSRKRSRKIIRKRFFATKCVINKEWTGLEKEKSGQEKISTKWFSARNASFVHLVTAKEVL